VSSNTQPASTRSSFFVLRQVMPRMHHLLGLGRASYGRIAVTRDVDRPWIIDGEELRTRAPLGRRDEGARGVGAWIGR
jgi:hypothetical protein